MKLKVENFKVVLLIMKPIILVSLVLQNKLQ